MNQLQRVIFAVRIEAKHARNLRKVAATAGALTLLTTSSWSGTPRCRKWSTGRARIGFRLSISAAPVAFGHIKMHGKLHFPLSATPVSQ